MRKYIKRVVALSLLIAVGLEIGACLPPPGQGCGDGWCAEDYRCASVDRTPICIKSSCGNGIEDAGEACDDGNLDDNDSCLQVCETTTCGDSRINRTEECDDGNDANGDGCDNNCTVTACGNGIITAGEMCDDGNGNDNYDGCKNDCAVSLLAYLKASNTGGDDLFGWSVALSADGSTLAVGAWGEDGAATMSGGDQADNSASKAGAVYVFTRSGTTWRQQAYVKASNAGAGDEFGRSVALSADGSTLAVGARKETSAAKGINGDQLDNSIFWAGAVYVYKRNGTAWNQQAYIKASNTDVLDQFGWSVALSADGTTLAVGATWEASAAKGIDGNQGDNSASAAGAVYIFTHSGTAWSQQAYVKASNAGSLDQFGWSVALSADGSTLAVGAKTEASMATGIDGNQDDDSVQQAGAVYVFTRSGAMWRQQAYVKASNTDWGDQFGWSVALSADGATLAVGAWREASAEKVINGNQADNSAPVAGAVYVFTCNGTTWSQQAYVKASNTDSGDEFGSSVALSADGATLAVGAIGETSAATGIGGDPADNTVQRAGAVYVYTHNGTTWNQQAYVKASNTDPGDELGSSIALSDDGSILALGASVEDGRATGIGGDQLDNSETDAGAVYVFSGRTWLP